MANMTSVKTFFNYFYILYLEFKILLYVCKTNMTNMTNKTMTIEYKTVTELSKGDLCFLESADKSATAFVEISYLNESKSDKFITIYFYPIELSDRGIVGNRLGDNFKHPVKGELHYMSRAKTLKVEMA